MKYFTLGLIIVIAGLFAGFNYSSGSTFSESAISYEKQVRSVFKKNCASCHNAKSGLGDWLVYDQAFASRYAIQQQVQSRTMPQHGGSRMSESARDLINMWVNTGAGR